MEDQGYFIFSLDTELATGRFDRDEVRHKMFSADGSLEREAIYQLIELFEEFNIIGTWAIVGHLFYDRCEYCELCPLMDWKGKYSSFEEAYGTANPLWYGADIIEALMSRGVRQEIGFHGYSHKIFDEKLMSPAEAKVEAQEWLRVGKRKGIVPRSAVFPRHRIGHLDILKDAGMTCYRGEPEPSSLSKNKHFGKYIKTIDQLLGLSSIQVFDLTCQENHGLVILRPSEYLFDFNRRLELFLDAINLQNIRIKRIIDAIRRAAREKKMIHIWAHPCEFRTKKDFSRLREIFIAVSEEVEQGRMQSVGMAQMASLLVTRKATLEKTNPE